MAFESGIVPEDWSSDVIVPLYKGKGEGGLNVGIIDVIELKYGWINICRYISRQESIE